MARGRPAPHPLWGRPSRTIGAVVNLSAVPDRTSGREEAGPRGEEEFLAVLLSRASRGDEDAFATLYDQTAARVYGMVLRVVRDPSQADEVTQEVYVEVWRLSARYDPERASVLGWMSMLAHRRAVDRVRSAETDRQRIDRYAGHVPDAAGDQVWEAVSDRMEAHRVRDGLASLTRLQQESLLLAYYGGYTQSQVAALLKVPLGTVKTRIRDGLIGLRNALRIEPDHHRGTP